jgi:hypothetical protein
MNQTSRESRASAQALLGPPVQVEDMSDRLDEVAERVRRGEALLRVVAYPWGVEFDLVEDNPR